MPRAKWWLPGFINAHTHFYSTFARGLTKTRPAGNFVDVLKNLWWRLDSALTTEDCYYSALIALLEAIRHGTTTLIDHHASPNAVRGSLAAIEKAVSETGLRACLCYELSDRDGARISKEGLEENVAFIRHCQRSRARCPGAEAQRAQPPTAHRPQPSTLNPQPTTAALFGLHAAFTLKDATLEKAAALGQELGTGFHIHVAEAESDQQYSQQKHRLRVVERLKKFGILGPRSIAAHCVHVNRREMDILAETQTAVVHNPQSNLNNAVGIADVVSMAKRNVLVGLGTDAMTTNMLEELRVALWAQHLSRPKPLGGILRSGVGALLQQSQNRRQKSSTFRWANSARGASGTWWSSIMIRPPRWRPATASATWSLACPRPRWIRPSSAAKC